jgi:prepilin-type N-terminal cleavage/methylation domain-containing protein
VKSLIRSEQIMKRRGFTLIELLVVISIIALLMAILMPVLRAAKAKAAGASCLSNLHNLSLAWVIYAMDNDGRLVGGKGDGSVDKAGEWVEYPQQENGGVYFSNNSDIAAAPFDDKIRGIERGALFPYVKNIKVYHCPADSRYKRPPTHHDYQGTCGGYRSYSIAGGMNGTLWMSQMKEIYHPCTIYTQIKTPAEKYVFVEDADPRGWNIWCWTIDITSPTWGDPLAGWHHNVSNLGFADGHAETHFWKDRSTIAMMNDPDWKTTTPLDKSNPDIEYMQKRYAVLRGPQVETEE